MRRRRIRAGLVITCRADFLAPASIQLFVIAGPTLQRLYFARPHDDELGAAFTARRKHDLTEFSLSNGQDSNDIAGTPGRGNVDPLTKRQSHEPSAAAAAGQTRGRRAVCSPLARKPGNSRLKFSPALTDACNFREKPSRLARFEITDRPL